MTKNISDIEKCAKLMGYEVDLNHDYIWVLDSNGRWLNTWNPYSNKSDLMDLECALSNICVIMNHSMCIVTADKEDGSGWEWEGTADYADHPDKFTARAHAVVAVAVQIYDRTNP